MNPLDIIEEASPWMRVVAFLVFCGALLGTGGYLGWSERSVRAQRDISNLQKTMAAERAQAVTTALQEQQAQLKAQHDKELKLAQIDKAEFDRLKGVKDENDRLRAQLRAGAVSLRIGAKCPAAAAGGGVPSAAPGPGVGAGGTAELDESARQAYLALRDGIATATGQLRACQAALKNLTGQ